MTRRDLVCSCAAALLSVAVVSAQGKAQPRPDFNGTWAMDLARSESTLQMSASAREQPVLLTIRQTPDALIIERQYDGETKTIRYAFGKPDTLENARTQQAVDSAPSRPVGTTGSSDPVAQPVIGSEVKQANAEWDGSQLVATMTLAINGMTTTTAEGFTLQNNGRELVVNNHLEVQHGYEATLSKPEGKGRDVYVRVK